MYIKTTTTTDIPSVTIAKASAICGFKYPSQINVAIRDEVLDYGYVFDELKKAPEKQNRPDAGTSEFGQKTVILNEKWERFVENLKK